MAGLLLSACGGEEERSEANAASDKAAYVEQGDHACRRARRGDAPLRRRLTELAQTRLQSTPRYLAEGTELQAKRSRIFSSLADRLRELGPPAADRAALESYIAGVDQVADLQSRLSQLARLGDRVQYDAVAKELAPISSRVGGIAAGYGFRVCGSSNR